MVRCGAPGVVYYFSPDRKGEHPRGHLAKPEGVLQADAYAGFKEFYEQRADGTQQFREAACWAHLRRDFNDVWTADSPRSPARPSTVSASSTTSSARSPESPRIYGSPPARNTVPTRSQPSRSGLAEHLIPTAPVCDSRGIPFGSPL